VATNLKWHVLYLMALSITQLCLHVKCNLDNIISIKIQFYCRISTRILYSGEDWLSMYSHWLGLLHTLCVAWTHTEEIRSICLNLYILSWFTCGYRQGMDWWIDLLTTYTHHSELQVITALSLISTLYKSPTEPTNPFPACCVISCSLGTASNCGDSSVSCSQVLSSQTPVQNMQNSTLSCQLPGWWPFHTNLLVISSQADFQLTGSPQLSSL
jgi:hypothetical protein